MVVRDQSPELPADPSAGDARAGEARASETRARKAPGRRRIDCAEPEERRSPTPTEPAPRHGGPREAPEDDAAHRIRPRRRP